MPTSVPEAGSEVGNLLGFIAPEFPQPELKASIPISITNDAILNRPIEHLPSRKIEVVTTPRPKWSGALSLQDQYKLLSIVSPPATVPIAIQVFRSTLSETNRTVPSAISTFTPPGCRELGPRKDHNEPPT